MSRTGPADGACARSRVAAAATPPPTAIPNSRLVRCRMLGMIDDEYLDRLLLSVEFQSKLFLNGGEERCARVVVRSRRRRLREPEFELHIVQPVDAARVEDRTIEVLLKDVDQPRHRNRGPGDRHGDRAGR